MLLLIDAGNTRLKWALLDPLQPAALGAWRQHGSVSHVELDRASAEWASLQVSRIIVSNVAGAVFQATLSGALPPDCRVQWFGSGASLAGITNHYREPTQLGSDRFAAAIGAHALYPDQHLIVATCGTATTIDLISAAGDFVGGMIAPGLQLMAQSLAINTAQLPQVNDPNRMAAQFAQHTEAAILSGCLTAQVGAIEHAVRHCVELSSATTTSAEPPLCILSGGAAQFVQPSLRIAHKLVDNLVLIGLQAYSHTLC